MALSRFFDAAPTIAIPPRPLNLPLLQEAIRQDFCGVGLNLQ